MADIIPFPSLGFIADEIPYELFKDLCESVYNSKKRGNEVNHILVGQIAEEYRVGCSPPLLEYLSDLANKYNKEFEYRDWSSKYQLTGMWANFQKSMSLILCINTLEILVLLSGSKFHMI